MFGAVVDADQASPVCVDLTAKISKARKRTSQLT